MLSKLLKQDYLSTRRLFLPSYLVFAIIFLLNKIMFELSGNLSTPTKVVDVVTIIFMTLYIIAIVAIYVVTYVFICMHFYRTVAGEQGYLTHTLPVKTSTIINSKLLNSVFWQVISSALIILSLFIMFYGHTHGYTFGELWGEYLNFIKVEMYMDPGSFNLLLSVTFLISLFSGPLMFFCSIAIGHLFNKHKVGGAIVAYIGIYMVLQMFATMILFISGFFSIVWNNTTNFADMYSKSMLYSLILSIISSIVFYFITVYIFRRRVNLE